MKSSPPVRAFSRAGFTLLELVAVIAIIGVIMATLIPVIGNVRKNARTARAVSNIRQLVTAHYAFAADNKGKIPPKYLNGSFPTWQEPLAPYLGITLAFKPADKYGLRQDPESVFNVPDSKPAEERVTAATSIARNNNLPNPQWDYRLNAVPRPARTILLGECEEKNLDELCGLKADGITGIVSTSAIPGFRREGGTKALMGFCDGHVEALTREELSGVITAAEGNRWRWW